MNGPAKCVTVSPQCPEGQKHGYRLGYYHGQVAAHDDFNGTPCEQVRHEQEVKALRDERDALRALFQACEVRFDGYGIMRISDQISEGYEPDLQCHLDVLINTPSPDAGKPVKGDG